MNCIFLVSADGTEIVRKKGIALFKYNDRIGGADLIIGEGGDHVLLGAFTLLGVVLQVCSSGSMA